MGRLRSEQRQLEVELMRFCHSKLGARSRVDPQAVSDAGFPAMLPSCAAGSLASLHRL